ncbi:MAG: hypothetical protein K8S97_16130 [Anaerolineae bacterium]|nr:hypothetical protein [Anaerolineae bacterium]
MADTFLVRWERFVRGNPRLMQLQQPGIARSYPLLAEVQGRIHIRFFYHQADQVSADELYVGPPQVVAVLDFKTGTMLAPIRPEDLGMVPFKPMYHYVGPSRKPAIREYLNKLGELYNLVAAHYPNEDADDARSAFWRAFREVVPPVLLPSYRMMSHDFVAWLGV